MEAGMVSIPTNTHQGFSLIYLTGFVVILAVALTAQLLQLRWRAWFPGAEGDKSIINAVKDSVYTFMSYLT
jgi:light-harvesting complex 1 beta chain